ncbi:MAG: STAS domain-containing protein [Acidimicrobiaceae bacterium]|nr:STAS domain-containing protein [Acidimicrobiaceae bacterium]
MNISISCQEISPWTVLKVSGDLDVESSPEVRQAVIAEVASGARWIILDLSNVQFVDSLGIGVVVGALKRIRQRGGDMRLIRPESRIWRIFEICAINKIMLYSDNIDDLLYDS